MKEPVPLLELSDLRVERGGVRTLEIPSFCLQESEFVSLIGPNGAGKSTLLLAVMGLLKHGRGTLRFRGRAVESRADWLALRRRMAMVLQESLLFDGTVYDNVASGLKLRGMGGAETGRRVAACLERFGLAELAKRSAGKLSGGESKRVSLARAFAVEPEVILFDEPFANLDAPTRRSLAIDLDRIIRERGIAAVLVTHDQCEALRMSHRVVVMNGGVIVQQGAPAAVMNSPANLFTANFVGMETIVEGVVLGKRGGDTLVGAAGREIAAAGHGVAGEPVYCCLRPEQVTVGLAPPPEGGSGNCFAARVEGIDSPGHFLRLRLDCGFPLIAFLNREAFAAFGLREGEQLYASFAAASVHLIPRVVTGD